MKTWFLGLLMAGLTLSLMPTESEARRFGGGKSSGMQRAAPPAKPAAPPAASPNTPAAAGAAAVPKRSWLGPVAGLAAGLGLAALFSHLGLGEELANFVMLALLAVVAVVVIRMLMRRFGAGSGQSRLATATAGAAPTGLQRSRVDTPAPGMTGIQIGSGLAPAAGSTPAPNLPADFDTEGFERIARMIFIRMQAANDAADLDDLRQFTTPELFASLRVDLQDRGGAAQQTDVVRVDAQVLDFAQEGGQQIVSVRFQGEVREDAGATPAAFDEVWHLVKPVGDEGAWRIAGVQQPG